MGLKIVAWNSNGLAQRHQETKAFLLEHDVDILLVSETHFTDKNFLKIKNYEVYQTNFPNNKAHGGTAVIIKASLKHYEGEGYRKDFLQSTSVVIEDEIGALTVAAVYCPPKYKINQETFTNFFKTLGRRFLAAGDYNAKHPWWGSRLNTPNPKGRALYSAIGKDNLSVLSTGEPTYWPTDTNKIPDLIDFAVTGGINPVICRMQSCADLSSDHSPIIIHMSKEFLTKKSQRLLFNRNTDWSIFKHQMDDKLGCNVRLKSNSDLDDAIKGLYNCIFDALDIATPTFKDKPKLIYLPKQIEQQIREKRRLRRVWQKTRTPADKYHFNKAIKDLKKMLIEHKSNSVNNFLKNLTADKNTNYSLWKATKHLKRPKQHIPPLYNPNNSWARTPMDKANLFASHLKETFTPHDRMVAEEKENEILAEYPPQDNLNNAPNSVKIYEVSEIIKNLNSKKAPGFDGISGKVFKELPSKAVRYITILLNASYRLSYFPKQLKIAQIILIAKPGKDPTKTSREIIGFSRKRIFVISQ
ncbi:hypothetical protein TKK_0015548 [Trichogramma kaykai]